MDIITSRQNPLAVRLAKLSERKYRDEEGLFLAEGVKLSREAAEAKCVSMLVLTEGAAEEHPDVVDLAVKAGAELVYVASPVLEKISTESAPQGMIAVCSTALPCRDNTEPKGERIFILDRVRDPGNLGTILRSARAFGNVRLLLADCADIYNPKTVRGSMGAVFHVRTMQFPNTASAVRFAHEAGYTCAATALDENAEKLSEITLTEREAVVIGTEGEGLPQSVIDTCERTVFIPMSGGESLNCAVAASVVMWELYKKY